MIKRKQLKWLIVIVSILLIAWFSPGEIYILVKDAKIHEYVIEPHVETNPAIRMEGQPGTDGGGSFIFSISTPKAVTFKASMVRYYGEKQKIYNAMDLARMYGVHPNTIRLYEKLGFISQAQRNARNEIKSPAKIRQIVASKKAKIFEEKN